MQLILALVRHVNCSKEPIGLRSTSHTQGNNVLAQVFIPALYILQLMERYSLNPSLSL